MPTVRVAADVSRSTCRLCRKRKPREIAHFQGVDPETPLEETMGGLAHAVASGKAIYAGISNYDAGATRRVSETLRAMGPAVLLHQPVFNLFNRWVEDGLSQVLIDEGIGCIPFSPLAQGVLAGRYLDGVATDSRAGRDKRFLRPEHITDEKRRRVAALAEIAASRGQTLAQLSIAWLLAKPFVTTVLIGASRPAQIDENLGAANNTSFTVEELTAIDRACLLGS